MADMDMDRIRDEMAREQPGSPIEAIGEYVTERLNQGASVPEGRTLAGAYKAIEDWARKNRSGKSCVCVPPKMAFAIVDRYFGFGEEEGGQSPTKPDSLLEGCTLDAALRRGEGEKPQAFAAVKPVKQEEPDSLDLDALLEGL